MNLLLNLIKNINIIYYKIYSDTGQKRGEDPNPSKFGH